jgi:hypothetical protein
LPGRESDGKMTAPLCVATVLNDQFTDASGKPIVFLIGTDGNRVSFEDISFFPVRKENFLAANLELYRPASSGSDPYGDLGLGRQQLLLKWLLEGEYVEPFRLASGAVIQPGPGEDLDSVLGLMTNVGGPGIPALEGLEWGVLQQFNLAKSLGFIRIQGAEQSGSLFHDLFGKQVHDAAKAGIRAGLGQMVAVAQANGNILNINRGQYRSGGCVVPDPNGGWKHDYYGHLRMAACSSFEEYIASQAVRDSDFAQVWGFTPVFTPDQVQQVYRFFRIKADRTDGTADADIFTNELKAEDFIASVARFIGTSLLGVQNVLDAVQNTPGPVCAATQAPSGSTQGGVQNDARTLQAYYSGMCALSRSNPQQFLQRVSNLSAAVGGIQDKLTHGAILATNAKNTAIHVSNNGAASANGVSVRMFRKLSTSALLPPVESAKKQVTLPGGHGAGFEQWVDFIVGQYQPSMKPCGSNTDVKQPNPSNPCIDQSRPDGNAYPVTFVIDLPERSVKEQNRQNNWNGFYYWVLNLAVDIDAEDQPAALAPQQGHSGNCPIK